MHTVSEPVSIPEVLAAYTVVINYILVRNDIEEELLDRFLVLAKPRIDVEKFGLLQVNLILILSFEIQPLPSAMVVRFLSSRKILL